MSKIKRRTTSGAPTEAGTTSNQQSVSEVIKTSFVAWGQAQFPDEFADPDANPILLATYFAGAYTGAKLLNDNAAAFAKGAFEAHGAAVQAAKAPPITA